MSFTPAILAFGFLTPAFAVAGGLLVGIPIVIHLLNRRRYKIVEWAAMSFLLAAMRKNRRRLRFEQLLLLITRCCAIGLVGVALARPLGCAGGGLAALVGRASGVHVILIDNSLSMAYEADRPQAKTHLDQAKRLAKQIVDRLSGGGESVVLITTASPARYLIAKPSYDLSAVDAAIDRVEQSYAGTDLPGSFDLALRTAGEQQSQPNRTLHLISDNTTSAWRNGHEKQLEELGPKLAAAFHVVDYDLARPQQANVAVLDVTPAGNLVRSSFANDFLATVRAYGATMQTPITWKLDNQPLPGGQTVALDAQTPPLTQSNPQIRTGGPHLVTVTASSSDRLPQDNTRNRVIDVAAELKVLIVEGKRGIGRLQGSGSFLQLALAPPKPDAGPGKKTDSYIQPEMVSDIELGSRVLGDYRAIILTDVGQVSPPVANALQSYVKAGGTLILFMGDQVSAENYNNTLLPRGLLPGTLTKRVTGGNGAYLFDFNPNGVRHRLLSAFRNIDKSGLETAQIFTYWQVTPEPKYNVERVLHFIKSDPQNTDPPDPAITLQSLGDGRVLFVATTADPEWTSFPAKPAYVTLMHELVSGSVASGERWMNIECGQPLELPASVQVTSLPTLRDAQNKEQQLEQTRRADGEAVYRSRPINTPGVYRLSTGSASYPIAVNVAADESDIRPLDPAAVAAALGNVQLDQLGDTLPPVAEAGALGKEFGWSILLIVLGLLGFECLIAMRFGRGRK